VLHDPHVRKEEPTPVEIERDLYGVLEGAHAFVIVTKHREYLDIDLGRAGELMAARVVVDGRNVFNKEEMGKTDFVYLAVGKDNSEQ